MEFVKNLQRFLQSYDKSLINQACSGPYWENIGPRSFLHGPSAARSVLSRPRADILTLRPSRLVNKIYVLTHKPRLHVAVNKRDFARGRKCIKAIGCNCDVSCRMTLRLFWSLHSELKKD